MSTNGLRARIKDEIPKHDTDLGGGLSIKSPPDHIAGPIKHGIFLQGVRLIALLLYFLSICLFINFTQFLGAPLYFIHKPSYYAWMALTKQNFGVLLVSITQWFASPIIRVSGDESVRDQLRLGVDGRLEVDFPERLVMLANHQIYTDWIYMWWTSYAARKHGYIYIILKESLKYVPILGNGMLFYGFIFMARNWTKDKPRLEHRLSKLKRGSGASGVGDAALDPMWLLIFPEGTNLSNNGRDASKKWADKAGLEDLRHLLLPRSTGLQCCLQQLGDTVKWVYDCTIYYEGVPPGEFGQDIFSLRATYFQGRVPKSVNMHWRRFAVPTIPVDDPKAFDEWVRARWLEKDELMDVIEKTGRFPADSASDKMEGSSHGPVLLETEVRQSHFFEFLSICAPLATFAVILNIILKLWRISRDI